MTAPRPTLPDLARDALTALWAWAAERTIGRWERAYADAVNGEDEQ